MNCRPFPFYMLASVLMICLAISASAQTATPTPTPVATPTPEPGPEPIVGTIVSVRGSIYQMRQRYLRGVARFLATDQTTFLDRDSVGVSVLTPGMRVIAYGQQAKSCAVDIEFLRASKTQSAFARWGVQSGIKPDPEDGPDWVMFGGILTKLSPFTVVGDDKKMIPGSLSISKLKTVDYWIQSGPSQLMIGRKAFVIGSRRESDILLASQVFLMRSPGNPGTIFGDIVSVGKNKIVVMPRFGADPITVSYNRATTIQRQLTIDPHSIKIGDKITIWGGHSADSDDLTQLTAYVIMPGIGSFPGTSKIPDSDPTATGRDVTGTVTHFDPLIFNAINGHTYTVTVPGQTPTASYIPSSLSDLHAGSSVMLICGEGAKAKSPLVAHTIVIDASPVVAMGF